MGVAVITTAGALSSFANLRPCIKARLANSDPSVAIRIFLYIIKLLPGVSLLSIGDPLYPVAVGQIVVRTTMQPRIRRPRLGDHFIVMVIKAQLAETSTPSLAPRRSSTTPF